MGRWEMLHDESSQLIADFVFLIEEEEDEKAIVQRDSFVSVVT